MMSRWIVMYAVTAFVTLACGRPATPCQRLIDGIASRGQSALVAANDPQTFKKTLDPASFPSWDVGIATAEVQKAESAYRKTVQEAIVASSETREGRPAAVLAAKATIVALSDVAIVCAGER